MSRPPVCVKCAVDMRPEKNGFKFVEMSEGGRAYQVWDGDKWKCPRCGVEVIVGWGQRPLAGHWDEHFKPILDEATRRGEVLFERRRRDE